MHLYLYHHTNILFKAFFIWISFVYFVIQNALNSYTPIQKEAEYTEILWVYFSFASHGNGNWKVAHRNYESKMAAMEVCWMYVNLSIWLSPDNQLLFSLAFTCRNIYSFTHNWTSSLQHLIIAVSVSLECASFRVNQWFSSVLPRTCFMCNVCKALITARHSTYELYSWI